MGIAIGGICALVLGGVLWLWATRRLLDANAGLRVPFFHRPIRRPDYYRTLNTFGGWSFLAGGLLMMNSPLNNDWPLVAVLYGAAFVLSSGASLGMIAIHNRRGSRSDGLTV